MPDGSEAFMKDDLENMLRAIIFAVGDRGNPDYRQGFGDAVLAMAAGLGIHMRPREAPPQPHPQARLVFPRGGRP